MTRRVVRKRSLPPLKTEFAINFKLELGSGEGVTVEEMKGYVQECMRYASAAFLFKVSHPTKDRDLHGRQELCGHPRLSNLEVV